MTYQFPPMPVVAVPVQGSGNLFPVHRIYCVGKNYAAHIREMGSDPSREAPCFFMKPNDAIVLDGKFPYPPGSHNVHYEGELVIAIGKGGRDIPPGQALDHVLGFALGLDMTRRDLQVAAGRIGMPWDTGKGFDHSAPLSAIVPRSDCGDMNAGAIRFWLNDELRQDADLDDLIWKNHEIVAQLSRLFELQAGDLVFTGTPAGVGAVKPGDRMRLEIAGLGELQVSVTGD